MSLNCFVIGVNHKTADTSARSHLSVSDEVRGQIYTEAKKMDDVEALMILNTCNRTEIAGLGNSAKVLHMYKSLAAVPEKYASTLFVKQGAEAVEHMFQVASGLDSQILGDLEILGQFKRAFQESKNKDLLNGYFERLGNCCIQGAKEVKHTTEFSSGTTSLSYAVVQYLNRKKLKHNSRILIIGSGKFGAGTAKNIVHYFPGYQLYVTNRTAAKAKTLADKLQCNFIRFEDWKTRLSSFDIVITTIDTPPGYILDPTDLKTNDPLQIIDLSVPYAVNPNCGGIDGKSLTTVDELSEIINSTLQKRSSEIQAVKQILQRHMDDFLNWSHFYGKSESIRAWKANMQDKIKSCPFLSKLSEDARNQYLKESVADFAKYVKKHDALPDDGLRQEMMRTGPFEPNN